MDGSGKDENLMLLGKHSLSNEPNSRVLAPVSSFRSESSPIGPSSSYGINTAGYTGPSATATQTQLVQMIVPCSTQVHSLHHRTGDIALNIDHSAEKNPSFEEEKSIPCSKENCAGQERNGTASKLSDPKADDALCCECLGQGFFSFLYSFFTKVYNPHDKFVQNWNRWFVIFCLMAIFVDPLFFFLLSTQPKNKCIVINWTMTTTLTILRTISDFVYLLNILLQFKVAYINPETRQFGVGDVVNNPKKIVQHYLSTYFYLDLFNVLPLPQILILVVLPQFLGSSGANTAKNFLRAAILVQYIPRLIRFLPLLAGQSPSGFIFETAWANFVINLLTYVLAAHVVGSCWYLFGLQRVNQCLRDACSYSGIDTCIKFIDCGYGSENYEGNSSNPTRGQWIQSINASSCFTTDSFNYGIYQQAVDLTTKNSIITRYVYAFFWGFQQLSTLAGNQVPSYFVWEVLFTAAIVGLGLLLFALLIGNMQNFLQALGKRRLKMSLRRLDCEQWMKNRRFPKELKRQIRKAERHNWVATRGIDEEMLLNNLPEDLQRDIRHHLCEFIKNNNILCRVDKPMLESIFERLKAQSYMKGSKILDQGSLIEKIVFIVHGEMESIGDEGGRVKLSKGDTCGEELLTHYLDHSPEKTDAKKSFRGLQLRSNRSVQCLTHVEAFTLRAEDIEELVARFSHHQDVPGAMRHDTPHQPGIQTRRVQVAWRCRKRRLNRA